MTKAPFLAAPYVITDIPARFFNGPYSLARMRIAEVIGTTAIDDDAAGEAGSQKNDAGKLDGDGFHDIPLW